MTLLASDLTIRTLQAGDRSRVEAMTRSVGLFWDYEIPIAMEVFDDATGANASGVIDPDYETAGVEVSGVLKAWAVFGPRPNQLGTFDLYWIVVDPDTRGRGVGGILIEEMERRIAGRVTRLVVETSGRADYEATRQFYRHRGFLQIGLNPDYYAPGDDQVVFEKRY